MPAHLLGVGERELQQERFYRVVERAAGMRREHCRQRGDVHDPTLAPLDHPRCQQIGEMHGRRRHHLNGVLVTLPIGVPKLSRHPETRIVDERIDRQSTSMQSLGDCGGRIRIGQVHHERDRRHTKLALDFAGCRTQSALAPCNEHNLEATTRELARESLANAVRRTGDQGAPPVFEPAHAKLLRWSASIAIRLGISKDSRSDRGYAGRS